MGTIGSQILRYPFPDLGLALCLADSHLAQAIDRDRHRTEVGARLIINADFLTGECQCHAISNDTGSVKCALVRTTHASLVQPTTAVRETWVGIVILVECDRGAGWC